MTAVLLAAADLDPQVGAVLIGLVAVALAVIGIIVSLRGDR